MILSRLLGRNKPVDRRQKLIPEDLETYGEPESIPLAPPETGDPRCREKARCWLDWRAAPYPAERHAQYLEVPGDSDRVLISAILNTPQDLDSYLGNVRSKVRYRLRGVKAEKLDYRCRTIDPAAQAQGIRQIVLSCTTRQNRAVEQRLLDRPGDYDFPDYGDYADPAYQDICMGVFSDQGELAAFLLGKRVGDHVQYDEIMGHAQHLHNDVMYLLHLEFVRTCAELAHPPRYLHYGPWYSGANPFSPHGGLNRWKRKTGFRPAYLMLRSS